MKKNPFSRLVPIAIEVCANEEGFQFFSFSYFTGVGKWASWPLARLRLPEILEHEKWTEKYWNVWKFIDRDFIWTLNNFIRVWNSKVKFHFFARLQRIRLGREIFAKIIYFKFDNSMQSQ